ncbi:ice-binding family protein [Flavobacterium ovatum]|uniref:ice-binding family protein n=1 Tax=Flavobacterium ovatum TaxID=1928857 RepID=UPI00344F2FF9
MKKNTFSKKIIKTIARANYVKTIFVLFLVFGSTAAFGQTEVTRTAAGTTSFTAPTGITAVTVQAWGSGGAGGGSSSNKSAGSGGGGGAYSFNNAVIVLPGTTYTSGIVVGAAGAAGSVSGAAGGNGNPSSVVFGTTVTANGGQGGNGNGINATPVGDGGAAGIYSGGNGGSGTQGADGPGGGGGSSAGISAAGNNGAITTAGAAVTGGGAGGAGGASGVIGSVGLSPGGGGGGGGDRNGATSSIGGNGAVGKVIISYFQLSSTPNVAGCIGTSATITVTGTAVNLPAGTYTVVYDLSAPNASTNNSTTMTVSAAGTGTFGTVALNSVGVTTLTITSIASTIGSVLHKTTYDSTGNAKNKATITVASNNTVGAASSTPTLCINTAMTSITHSTTGATGIGLATGLPTGVTASWVLNTITISGTPTNSGAFNYSIPLTGGCGTVNATGTITVTPVPATPGAITGKATQCPSLTSQTYSISAVTNATTYNWVVPTGWTITAGSGTTSITVTTGTAGQNVNIAVSAQNSCGTSAAQTLAVTVSAATPATPGSITGTATQCPSLTSQTYSVSAVANATTYNWVVPTGWTITAGSGTSSITVTTGTAGQNGNITVSAQNSCGASALQTLAVTVSAIPATPGSISGTIKQYPGITNQVYSISAVANATTYSWAVPTGWSITSGVGTTSISVTTGSAGQNGNITVSAGNSCGTSAGVATVQVAVTVNLRSIENFTLYSSSGAVSNTAISDVTGNIGTNLGSVTGFGAPSVVSGSIETANSITAQAALDLNSICTQITNTITTNSTSGARAMGNGETLVPGVYFIGGATSIGGILTLDGQGDPNAQFIFKIGGAFTTAANATVVLINGASSANIFWMANGAIAMAASTNMSGTLIGNPGAVSMGADGQLLGRLLSTDGAISIYGTVASNVNINKWKGSISNNWNISGNWTKNSVPAADASILFDEAPSNHLVLDQNRSVTNIVNAQSVYRVVCNGYKLTLKGNVLFTNGAQIDALATNSIVEYAGISSQTIESSQYLNEKIFNLYIENTVGVDLNTDFTLDNNLIINSGKIFTIQAAKSLTVSGSITNNSNTSGLVLKSTATGTASLIHYSDNVSATVQRYISGVKEAWHFLSAPVSDQVIAGTSWAPSGTYGNGTGYDLYLWNEPTPCWTYLLNTTVAPTWPSLHPTGNFVKGRGYLYSTQALNPTKEFTGLLNNGNITYPLTNSSPDLTVKGFNLIGNPYPSSIDWKSISGWTRSDLMTSVGGYDMWIWNPDANNYGVYNSLGTTGTNSVTQYIPPTQGFFVRASTEGSVAMSNAVRVNNGASNWMKIKAEKENRLKVKIESKDGNGFDEVLAEFGYDSNEAGALKLFSRSLVAPSIYWNESNKDLTVRYLTNVIENSKLPLLFKAGKSGSFTMTLDYHISNLSTFLLEDKKTNTIQDLNESPSYQFNATVNDADDRFVLHFAPIIVEPVKLPALIYYNGSEIVVDLTLVENKTTIKIYDIAGKLLADKWVDGKMVHRFVVNNKNEIYIVLANSNGKLISQKVFVY